MTITVLGFDTATPATAVALLLGGGETLAVSEDPPAGGRPGHATRLLAISAELLAQAGVSWGAIELVAVGVGPGSFTGLRIGVATARGLSQSLGVPLQGVGTLQALADAAVGATEPPAPGVLAVLDARRGEAFAAAYAGAQELVAPAAVAPDELPRVAGALQGCARRLAVGDGAVRFRSHLQGAGVDIPPDSSSLHRVSAASVCRLAVVAAGQASGTAQAVLPDYRRQPDAEIAPGGGSDT